MVGHINNAVPADAFSVPPLPLSAFEGHHISAKRISFERINRSSDASLYIS